MKGAEEAGKRNLLARSACECGYLGVLAGAYTGVEDKLGQKIRVSLSRFPSPQSLCTPRHFGPMARSACIRGAHGTTTQRVRTRATNHRCSAAARSSTTAAEDDVEVVDDEVGHCIVQILCKCRAYVCCLIFALTHSPHLSPVAEPAGACGVANGGRQRCACRAQNWR